MVNIFYTTISLLIFTSVVLLALFIILWFVTRNYKENLKNLYGLFLNTSQKSLLLLSSYILCLIFNIFFLFFLLPESNYGLYALIAINGVSILLSLFQNSFIPNIIYGVINVVVMWLYIMVSNYLELIYFDNLVWYLMLVMMIMIFIYSLYVATRRIELFLEFQRKEIKKLLWKN